jgi:hypothetical protein
MSKTGWLIRAVLCGAVLLLHNHWSPLGSGEQAVAEGRHHGHHEAYHDGVLNVIGREDGHIEVRVKGDTLEAWFVGGGDDTNRSVPIKAEEVFLKVRIPGQSGERSLVLKAAPLRLAGEKVGKCSHFVGRAVWLSEGRQFEAVGEVVFRGVDHKLFIKYPHGYDPMHDHRKE